MEIIQPVFDHSFFTSEEGIRHNKKIIWIKFPKDFTLIKLLKSVAKPHWSNTQKSWYITDNHFNRELFGLPMKTVGKKIVRVGRNYEHFLCFENFASSSTHFE